MKVKKFDTIIMKRKAKEKISKQIEGFSEKELLEYWNQFTLKNGNRKSIQVGDNNLDYRKID